MSVFKDIAITLGAIAIAVALWSFIAISAVIGGIFLSVIALYYVIKDYRKYKGKV